LHPSAESRHADGLIVFCSSHEFIQKELVYNRIVVQEQDVVRIQSLAGIRNGNIIRVRIAIILIIQDNAPLQVSYGRVTILMYNLGLSDADPQLIASLLKNSFPAKNET
jgi:hypothetical protein